MVGRPVMPRWGTFDTGNRPGCAVSVSSVESRLRRSRHPATQGSRSECGEATLRSLGAAPPAGAGLSALCASTFACAKAGCRVPRPPPGSRGGGVAPTRERPLGRPLPHDAGAVHTLRVRLRRLCGQSLAAPPLPASHGLGAGQRAGLGAGRPGPTEPARASRCARDLRGLVQRLPLVMDWRCRDGTMDV